MPGPKVLASVGSVSLPSHGGRPFVAPDGKLPSPRFATFAAVLAIMEDSEEGSLRRELVRDFVYKKSMSSHEGSCAALCSVFVSRHHFQN